MKKLLAIIGLTTALAFGLTACGGGSSDGGKQSSGDDAGTSAVEQKQSPLDLTGEWKQVNSNSEDSYQVATISDSSIEVNWVSPDSKSLYWAGTYEAPTEAVDSYSWDSENDTSKTANALMASDAETKTFSYKDGKLSYELTALGTTMTVEMERQ